MKVLLLIAHGSRKELANQEIHQLAEKVQRHNSNAYEAVVPAFLEFAEPDIATGFDYCAQIGATSITVVPYFLASGAHVTRDIPNALKIAAENYPKIEVSLTKHFGASDSIVESVMNCASVTG